MRNADFVVFFAARSGAAVVVAAVIAVNIPGWLFSLGSMGGGALPWLSGATATTFGSLRVALIVPSLGSLLLTSFVLHEANAGRKAAHA